MIDIYRKTLKDDKLQKAEDFQRGSWVVAIDPTEEEIELLNSSAGIEKGHIIDALDLYEAPRLEIESSGLYIFLRAPFVENGHIQTLPILFVLTEDHLLVVAKDLKHVFDDFISDRVVFYTTQKTKLLLSLFLRIGNAYRSQLNAINRSIRNKQNTLEKITERDTVDFVQWENVLNDFITALVPASNIYKILLSKQYLKMFKEDQDLVEDLLLGNDENVDIAKTTAKTIVNIRNAYSMIVTNNLNKAIKFLTAITIILTLPTMIASVYGMNIRLPMQDSSYAFLFVLGLIVAVVVVAFWIFYREDWL